MSTAASHNVKFHRFATVLGGVVPIYHLEGLTRDLNFTADTLAAVYLGKVTRWNDGEIRNSNRGVNLPDAPIVVIHRSDGSGSTYAWSDFLSRINPEWKDKIGRGTKLKWPIGQGPKAVKEWLRKSRRRPMQSAMSNLSMQSNTNYVLVRYRTVRISLSGPALIASRRRQRQRPLMPLSIHLLR
jgi:PBP superfamily domain